MAFSKSRNPAENWVSIRPLRGLLEQRKALLSTDFENALVNTSRRISGKWTGETGLCVIPGKRRSARVLFLPEVLRPSGSGSHHAGFRPSLMVKSVLVDRKRINS